MPRAITHVGPVREWEAELTLGKRPEKPKQLVERIRERGGVVRVTWSARVPRVYRLTVRTNPLENRIDDATGCAVNALDTVLIGTGIEVTQLTVREVG